jgi:hypothetical protein
MDRQRRKEFILANNETSSNNNTIRNMNFSNLTLNERLIALSTKNEIDLRPISSELIESLPTEGKIILILLMLIFRWKLIKL